VKKTFEIKNEIGEIKGNANFLIAKSVPKPSFIEFLRFGWHINLSIAIDYAAIGNLI